MDARARPSDEPAVGPRSSVIAHRHTSRYQQSGSDDAAVFDWLAGQFARYPQHASVGRAIERELHWNFTLARRSSLEWAAGAEVDQGPLAGLLAARWKAAAADGQWTVLRDDLSRIERTVRLDAPEVWSRQVLIALNLLLWGGDAEQSEVERLRDTLAQCEELQLRLPAVFDELDELDALRIELRLPANPLAQQMRAALRADALEDHIAAYQQLWQVAHHIAERGASLLSALTELVSEMPFTTGRLWSALTRYNGFRTVEFRSEHGKLLSRLAGHQVSSINWATSSPYLGEVVTFCTEYGIPARVVAMLIYENEDIPESLRNVAAQAIYNSPALGLLIEACQVQRTAGERGAQRH